MLHTAVLTPGNGKEEIPQLVTQLTNSDCENLKRCKQALDQVTGEIKFDPTLLLKFLVNTSVFELKLKEASKKADHNFKKCQQLWIL